MVHLVVASLLMTLDTFKVNYNSQERKWDLNELIVVCVSEEDRIKEGNTEMVNLVVSIKSKKPLKKNFQKKGLKFKCGGDSFQHRRVKAKLVMWSASFARKRTCEEGLLQVQGVDQEEERY